MLIGLLISAKPKQKKKKTKIKNPRDRAYGNEIAVKICLLEKHCVG